MEASMEGKFEAILHDDFYKKIELCWFCCGIISDKKKTADIVKKLAILHPMSGYLHLKRVKDIAHELHVLIQPVSSSSVDNESATAIEDIEQLYTTQVPMKKPLTRQQFVEAQNFWNCHFFEDKKLEKYLAGSMFSLEDVKRHKQNMQLAQDQAVHTNAAIGAVIIDPDSDSILARGHTDTARHPLKHAVMKCIDEIARLQGGGVWEKDTSIIKRTNDKETASVGIDYATEQLVEAPPKKRGKKESYLCTKYDLYTTHEPCIMCTMALVHSRIGRVFYMHRDLLAGGIGSRVKIHCHPNINHHFEVFRLNVPIS